MTVALGVDVNHACACISTDGSGLRWHRENEILSVIGLLD